MLKLRFDLSIIYLLLIRLITEETDKYFHFDSVLC